MHQESTIRSRLIDQIQHELIQNADVLALWEQGSAAFSQVDTWSDLDLYIMVKDGCTDAAWPDVERAMQRVSPIDLRYEVPRPTWHGCWQAFYRLEKASPFLVIDLVIIEESNPNKFLEREIHGTSVIYFDRNQVVQSPLPDLAGFAEKLQARLPLLEKPAEMLHLFVDKEIARGNSTDAIHFYQTIILGRLVEAFRIRYSPWRYNFGLRYLKRDLPHAVYEQVAPLCYVTDLDDLRVKKAQALSLLREALAELHTRDLIDLLRTHTA